jgi:hypothetical protein
VAENLGDEVAEADAAFAEAGSALRKGTFW